LSDNTPILFHDDERNGEVIESLSSQSFERLTRVSDLAQFAGRTTMILEVKRSKWETIVCNEVSAWPDIIVASFDHSTIAELSRRNVNFPLGLTIYGRLVNAAEYATHLGATWFFPGWRYVDRDLVDDMHAHNIKIVPWTPNRERDWEHLRGIGCDGVIT